MFRCCLACMHLVLRGEWSQSPFYRICDDRQLDYVYSLKSNHTESFHRSHLDTKSLPTLSGPKSIHHLPFTPNTERYINRRELVQASSITSFSKNKSWVFSQRNLNLRSTGRADNSYHTDRPGRSHDVPDNLVACTFAVPGGSTQISSHCVTSQSP